MYVHLSLSLSLASAEGYTNICLVVKGLFMLPTKKNLD